MNNKYVEIYCTHHDLKISPSSDVMGENYILQDDKRVGFYRDDDKFIEFSKNNMLCKKGDLILFIIENQKAH